MTRDEAWELLCEHTRSESLRKHGLAVEAAMRYFAARGGENEETWAITGLLHDFDYERDPAGHPQNGKPILEQAGVPGPIVHAIQSHGDHTGVPRVRIEKYAPKGRLPRWAKALKVQTTCEPIASNPVLSV